ncbi:hypothetical protein Pvag_2654 [Pantoea vagans C9-1]|nr:hypothetical protein Pvag_2654 [Pantoea vagans C9-1]
MCQLSRQISFKFPGDHHHAYPRDNLANARIVVAIKPPDAGEYE